MQTFVAHTPDTQQGALLMLGILDSLDEDRLATLLPKYGLPPHLAPGDFYLLQPFLDMLHDLTESDLGGMFDFVRIGMNIIDNTPFPPEVDDIPSAFEYMRVAYHENLIGEREDEGWTIEEVNDSYYVARQVSPFPADLEYGVAYGIVKRFRPPNKHFTIIREELPDDDWEFHIRLE